MNINIEISGELHKKIKLASIMQGVTLKDFIIAALEDKSRELKPKV